MEAALAAPAAFGSSSSC